ncbi:FeoA family protein [Erysipelotrichaceae bacterium 51-3]|uniref:FeoA family protein n=1 Tax=Allobaculum sp. JKK-2023 TaxID=3108943 RepID=UPI002B05EB54|nr:FeoA family protein [Allobaculum sp. JKK-2023]
MKTLNTVEIGQTVEVTRFDLDEATALRLQSLGMIIGTRITVLARKGKGTMIIDLRKTRFALGPSITDHIEVKYV